MKLKTTKKEVMSKAWKVFSIGYCDAQTMLRYQNAIAYTCGVYGWNADIYEIKDGVFICTGYRPFGQIINYDIVRKYEQRARDIEYSKMNWELKKEELKKLTLEMIEEVSK